MADVHNAAIRSYNMSQIKGKNTRPEILVRRFLHGRGFRFRLHVTDLPGTPDIVLPKYKTVIFVHGCFWHGHTNCKFYVIPKTRTEWWVAKINNNIAKDKRAEKTLRIAKWKIIIIWECQLKKAAREKTLDLLASQISE